jgi:hypothetical protein
MQALTTEKQPKNTSPIASRESLYRTRWLAAHNSLHSLVHGEKPNLNEIWSGYLEQLRSSEEVAATPA